LLRLQEKEKKYTSDMAAGLPKEKCKKLFEAAQSPGYL
jgi:hypothetical protein